MTKHRSSWQEFEVANPELHELLTGAGIGECRMFVRKVHDGELRALVSLEPPGWHLSISHTRAARNGRPQPGRDPTWDEIAHARDELLPADVGFVMHLPAADEYVALMDTCFHLWQHPELEQE
jgi:hypothetical protein